MKQLKEVQQQLELVFARYAELSETEQDAAVDMTVLLLRQMLRHKSGLRQKLAELGTATRQKDTKREQQSNAEKARAKLVRKSNAASPKAPVKPVQTTKKNELRRK